MSANDNPHFKYVDRAAYELPHLLRELPPSRLAREPMSEDQRQIAAAAQSHAENVSRTLLCGIESLGKVLTIASLNEEYDVRARHLVNLGELITHLAVEAQFVQELGWEIGGALAADDISSANFTRVKSSQNGESK